MKICLKCHKEKPLSAFYRHPKMADGHLNKCKDCTKADVGRYRKANLGRVQAYDRQRGLTPEHRAKVRAQYRKRTATKAGRKREWARQRQWMQKNRHKRNVHIVVGNAIKRGLIIPERCFRCGCEKTDAHHEDYSKPFDITWLCEKCHGERHREINDERRND